MGKEKAFELLKKNNLDLVVANTVTGFGSDINEIWIVDKKKNTVRKKAEKEILADFILDSIRKLL